MAAKVGQLGTMPYQWIDRRKDTVEFERKFRRWPRSGSVSKPGPSCEPETDAGFHHARFDAPGYGEPIIYIWAPSGEKERR